MLQLGAASLQPGGSHTSSSVKPQRSQIIDVYVSVFKHPSSFPLNSWWILKKKKEICLTMSHWSRTMVSIKMSVQLFKPGKSAKIYSLKVDFNSQLFAWNRFTWVPVWLCQPVVHRKTDFVYYCNAHRSHAIWSDFIVVWNTFYCSLSHQN